MPAPKPKYSSIDIEKDYLVKFIEQIILVTVVLSNASGNVEPDEFTVSLEADLQ